MRRRVAWATACLLAVTMVVGLPQTAAALTPGPPVQGASAYGAPLGDVTTNPGANVGASEIFCAPDRVLTRIDGTYSPENPIGTVDAYCATPQLVSGQARIPGGPERVGATLGSRFGYQSGSSQCEPNEVAVGLRGTTDYQYPLYETGVFSASLICRPVLADGTLDAAADHDDGTVGDPVNEVSDSAYCPAGSVATSVRGVSNFNADPGFRGLQLGCRRFGFPSTTPADVNLSWATALPVGANSSTSGAVTAAGQDRWYKFPVTPGTRVSVDLANLPVDADVALFTDIDQKFTSLTSTTDLNKLSAEFAGDAYAPSVFSPSVFSPSVFSPSVFSPSVFSPSVFSPSVFSPSVFSPSVFSPSVFSPSVFSPSAFSPSVFSPAVDLPSVFSPSVFSPSVFSPSVFSDAFSSAQTRSLIGVSARDGTAPENVSSATYNNTGNFYVRVQGRNGAFNPDPYTLTVTTFGSVCAGLDSHAGDATLTGQPGSAGTVILTDPARLPGTAAEKAALATQLNALATKVGGKVVDLGGSPKVTALNIQADSAAYRACPYAKNLVAQAVRDIVNTYRNNAGTLTYVVVVGGDSVVPFFRYPDTAGLGPESGYVPPVADQSASQASLKGNYVLGQDAYGSASDLTVKGATFPIPDLAVGRLVKSAAQITTTVKGYLDRGGAPIVPATTLSTGYDFLTDAADAVAADFAAGVPDGTNDTLITDADVPSSATTRNATPTRRTSWTADDLRLALSTRHDLTFLAGHFSANNTLAADYRTTLRSSEVATATDQFANTLVLSAGCHSGYGIVDSDGIGGVTDGLDWTEAFARNGATLVAGTGYQYGDTDFLAYSEKLYAGLVRQLRYGSGAVPVGQALAAAKQDYLRTTASLGGIDQKAVLEATLYGLPMTGVNLPGGRMAKPTDASIATPDPVPAGTPGAQLGLQTDDLTLNPTLTTVGRTLTNLDGGTVPATYLTGPDGVSTSPGEPALPLQSSNVTVSGQSVRGVALRSADYADTDGVTPLTGAAVTETAGVHGPFVTPAFFPARIATLNYLDAVGGRPAGGTTRLMLTPVQYRSDGPGSLTDTQRRLSNVGVRLFTSSYRATPNGNNPAAAAAPGLTDVGAVVDGDGLTFSVRATGDPSAGIQQVWVTYTGEKGSSFSGRWRSLDLTQDPTDSTRWTGHLTLPAGQTAAATRFLAQAVNGVGGVGVDDNQGASFTPGSASTEPPAATTLTPATPVPTTGAYGDGAAVSATLTRSGTAVAGQPVSFAIGASTRTAFTDGAGVARTTLPLTVLPGGYRLVASFDGAVGLAASATSGSGFTVTKQVTRLTVAAAGGSAQATLTGRGGVPLPERTVVFAYLSSAGTVLSARTVSTTRTGVAALDLTGRPAGAASLTATFGSATTKVPGGTVDLSDPSYAAVAPVALALSGTVVTAKADGYTVAEGSTLTVAKPGVLGNDTNAPTATLLSAPSSGDLVLNADGSFAYTPADYFAGSVTFTYRAANGSAVPSDATVTITVSESTGRCTIKGTTGNDTLVGTSGRDIICGLAGDDVIDGGGGNDVIVGGLGNDTLRGGDGNDWIFGRAGNDTIEGGTGDDKLSGGLGLDRVDGGTGDDLLDLRDNAGGDTGIGGAGRDRAYRDPGDTVTSVP